MSKIALITGITGQDGAKEKFGWEPKVKFDKLEEIMVKEDLNRWERWLNGERFPWDASNYPNEVKIITRSLRV